MQMDEADNCGLPIADFGLGRTKGTFGIELQEPDGERMRRMRNLFANVCLVLVSCVVGLALCEVSLRLFYPKYRHLADAQFRRDAERIYSRPPHQRSYVAHPDTGSSHPFYHNNPALRQHRNFSEADLASSINIGIFGDSYVENIRMAAQYSFTEPLDYLLNQHGEPFNVLNFGVMLVLNAV